MSWTKEENIKVRDDELQVIDRIFHSNSLPRLDYLVDAAHEKQDDFHHHHSTDKPIIEEHFE